MTVVVSKRKLSEAVQSAVTAFYHEGSGDTFECGKRWIANRILEELGLDPSDPDEAIRFHIDCQIECIGASFPHTEVRCMHPETGLVHYAYPN